MAPTVVGWRPCRRQGSSGPPRSASLAARLGIRPTKTWGQNFVIDANTVQRIARVAGIGADDVVVEVGPGLGSLTLALLPVARHVTVVEVDPVLAEALPETVRTVAPAVADRLTVVHADALRVEEAPGDAPTALVANLPYNVSVPVVLSLPRAVRLDRTDPRHGPGSRSPNASPPSPAPRPTACRASRRPGTPTSRSRATSAVRCSGRCPTSTPALCRSSVATRPGRRPPVSRSSPASTRPSPSAARRCGPPSPRGPVRPRRPRPRSSPPASTRAPVASRLDVHQFAAVASAHAANVGASVAEQPQ